jgi:hypothetical protein
VKIVNLPEIAGSNGVDEKLANEVVSFEFAEAIKHLCARATALRKAFACEKTDKVIRRQRVKISKVGDSAEVEKICRNFRQVGFSSEYLRLEFNEQKEANY